jgi:hypothetical protein
MNTKAGMVYQSLLLHKKNDDFMEKTIKKKNMTGKETSF